jgi:hypothetical protein
MWTSVKHTTQSFPQFLLHYGITPIYYANVLTHLEFKTEKHYLQFILKNE